MRTRSGFLIGFIAAAITFATLMAFAKPFYADRRNGNSCWHANKKTVEPTDTTKTGY